MSPEPGGAPDQRSVPSPEMVVAVGASAGGVAALKQFFAQVPRDTRAAFVVVLHLSPDHESHLSHVLQTATSLPVDRLADRTRLAAGHVYVISPNSSLTVADGDVVVSAVTTPEQRHAPVDVLFRTLAEAQGTNAVGVVLSGTGPNGSSGLKWIKEHGGLVLAQDPAEAEFADMPRNALATGLVDYALPAAAIPDAIARYFARRATPRLSASADGEDGDGLRDLVTLLRVRTGHDFSNYKQGTVLRRVARRMHVHGVSTLRDYARFLRDSPEEAGLLLNELLISVTSFFRDPQPYEVIEQRVVPQLFAGKGSSEYVRAWVAGCATGEEAYSVAMLLAEAAANVEAPPAIQVFGSDLDERAISIAREGVYSQAEVAEISEERLRRFFVRDQARYRVRRELREIMLFAHHDIIKDPPFSHLDLVVCRNVLIYLNRPMQQRLIETFHFALRPGGYLFLGGSETVDAASDLFAPFDNAARIYESRTGATRQPPLVTEVRALARPRVETRVPEIRPTERQSPADLHQRLLEQYAPPSIVVTEEYQVIHISESAARYLAVPAGEPSRDLLRLLRPELRVDMRTALHKAVRERASVEVQDIPLGADGGRVTIGVRPVLRDGDPPRGFLLVVVEPATGTEQAPAPPLRLISPTELPVSQLEEELARVKQQLSATVEQYESHVEEAKASNEELQAMNEELRSAAEELETSKEELQSVNEELTTVNQELKTKIEELATTNNDFQNYINSTDIGTIFVDRALCVKLFTPRACDVFHLVESDIGRPLAHIANTLAYDQLHQDIGAVLDRLQTIEREIQGANARWYLMRLLPYRTLDDRIDGVVVTFLDITNRVAAESQVRTSEERLRLLIDSATDYAIFAMAQNGDVAFWNAGAERMFGYTAADVVGRHASLIFTPEDRAAGALERELERAQLDGRSVDDRVYVRKDGARLFSRSVTTRLGHAALGFVTIARDLSAQRDAADALARAAAGMEERVAQRTQDLQHEVARRTIAHEHVTDLMHRLITTREEERARIARGLHEQLGGQLTTLRLTLEQLRKRSTAAQPADDGLNRALALTEALGSRVDLLAWELRPTLLDDLGLAAALPRFVREWSAHYGIPVEVRATAAITGRVSRDVEITFYRIALEALNNIALHAHATRADVLLEVRDGSLELIVKDDGIGFEPTSTDGAQGIGLLGMGERASLVGATLEVESAPGSGTRVSLRYPMSSPAEPATRAS
jgi:two-component system, chemotaxis family, CheB/CheR fusion protein